MKIAVKRVCLVLMLLLVFVGSGFAYRAGQTLTFYFWGDKTEYNENAVATQEVAHKLGVTVINHQEQGDYETGLLTRIAANRGPDFFYVPDWWLPELASKGVLLNLDSYVTKDSTFKRSSFVPASLRGMTFNGHLYGLPRGISGVVLYYNKDIFDKMHVAYPSASWTMTDLLNAAKKLTTKDHWGLMLHAGPGDKPDFHWALWQFGAEYINAARNQCTLTTPKAEMALQWLHDVIWKYKVAPSAAQVNANGGFSGTLFNKGKVAMVYGAARWFYDYAPLTTKPVATIHWSTQLPPLAMDGKRYVYAEYAGMGIWAKTKNPDLAYKVGSAISQSAGQKAIAQAGIDLPAYMPALSSAYIAPDKNADKISIDALRYLRIPLYVTRMKEVQAALDHDLGNLWLDKDTVAHAAQTTCSDINPLLK